VSINKFNRNYLLQIQELVGSLNASASQSAVITDIGGATTGGLLEVTLPFTIEFDITRNTLSSANVCQIRVYNLAEIKRNFIRHNEVDYGNYRAIQLKAGYGDNIGTIFKGNVSSAWSVREGNNFITQIECYDGGTAWINGTVDINVAKGTTIRDTIKALAANLPHVDVGHIGGYFGALTRGASYSGSAMQLIDDLTGGGAFIDLEKLNALRTNEFIAVPGGPAILDNKSGIVGTPLLERGYVKLDMIFEPLIQAGQLAFLQSSTDSNFNGEYIVKAVKHRGTISAAVCGSVITSLTLWNTKSPIPVGP
jgi:hypothetical protein